MSIYLVLLDYVKNMELRQQLLQNDRQMLSQFTITLERLQKIHELIKHRSTGNRDHFAEKVGLSISHLSSHLNFIRNQGINIKYDLINECYYYDEEVEVVFGCGFKKIKSSS